MPHLDHDHERLYALQHLHERFLPRAEDEDETKAAFVREIEAMIAEVEERIRR